MKNKILPLVFFALSLGALSAQQGQQPPQHPQPPTADEQVAMWDEKLDLDADQEATFLSVITTNAEKMETLMKDGARPSREDMEALQDEMNEELKACLTRKQTKKYEKALEEMMPQGGPPQR